MISVFAGSGGVGASTFAVNLATHAVTRGMSAVVIDLDQFGGGIDLVFGAEEIPGTRWSDIDPGSGRISADTLAAALPRANGVAFLSQSRSCLGGASVEIVAAVIDAARRAFDLVVLDLPREHSECNELLIGRSMVTCVITRNRANVIASDYTSNRALPNQKLIAITVFTRKVKDNEIKCAPRCINDRSHNFYANATETGSTL